MPGCSCFRNQRTMQLFHQSTGKQQLILNYNHIQPCTICYSVCEHFQSVVFTELYGYNSITPQISKGCWPPRAPGWLFCNGTKTHTHNVRILSPHPTLLFQFNIILVTCINYLIPNQTHANKYKHWASFINLLADVVRIHCCTPYQTEILYPEQTVMPDSQASPLIRFSSYSCAYYNHQ